MHIVLPSSFYGLAGGTTPAITEAEGVAYATLVVRANTREVQYTEVSYRRCLRYCTRTFPVTQLTKDYLRHWPW